MNWGNELIASSIWLAKAYALTLIVFVPAMLGLMRWTVWGRQFRLITGAYFSPRTSLRPLLMLGLMLLVSLMAVRLNLVFSFWYNDLYTSLQNLDAKVFWLSVWLFALLASLHIVRLLLDAFIRKAFRIHWRVWLNEQLLNAWMSSRAYYLARHAETQQDNPEQRIQEDTETLGEKAVELALDGVKAVVSIVAFTTLLWTLSGSLTVMGHEVSRAMVFLVYVYVLTTSFFAFWIGRPLIRLNFLAEQFSATYRYLLIRIREYGESIALYGGEKVEKSRLEGAFGNVIANSWATLWRELKFNGFNFTIGQVGVIFPLLIQGPRVLSGAIKLGDLMQTLEAFNQVQDALSFFRESYDKFAIFRAVLDRLSGFVKNMTEVNALPVPSVVPVADRLTVNRFSVLHPEGDPLISELSFSLVAGERLLVRGPSGAGKTTLLRAVAGLWPYTRGELARPTDANALFLSQRPYLPVGGLRLALAYPGQALDDALAREVLQRVQLPQLVDLLDDERDWSQILSPGEQQRLAFGRVLVNRPRLLVMDEATSALDAGLEHALYAMIIEALPDSIVLSVGHHTSLAQFHQRALELHQGGAWQIVTGDQQAGVA
ncbi:ABC transporter ATP-binding protein/permease [Viridibacterium curvum]|uniref:ABC transporter ATP-binding protein/permease n=1 Tax=Viridibacterium curvum TaxID=1101404 RepID=A0ABP9QEQ9_9RHOO